MASPCLDLWDQWDPEDLLDHLDHPAPKDSKDTKESLANPVQPVQWVHVVQLDLPERTVMMVIPVNLVALVSAEPPDLRVHVASPELLDFLAPRDTEATTVWMAQRVKLVPLAPRVRLVPLVKMVFPV